MAEIAHPHQTRPNRVLITEPITLENRGQIARWVEDQGLPVAVPADHEVALVVVYDRRGNEVWVQPAHRIVIDGLSADVVDHAHYKLWYEPIEEGT